MHETIPLQILNPLTELFEVGHTSPPTVQMHKSSHGLTSDLSPRTSNRGHDAPQLICAPEGRSAISFGHNQKLAD